MALSASRPLSEPQERALSLLSFAVPLHHTYLAWSGVRGPTLTSLQRRDPPLVRLTYLYEGPRSSGIPFWTLTQAGEKAAKSFIRRGDHPCVIA